MFRLFRDRDLQAAFERDGYVRLPLLEPDDVERLRAHYLDFSGGGQVENSIYGMFVSLDEPDVALKLRTIDLLREVTLSRLDRHVFECKSHLGSYLVKVPNPQSYTFPHQDWMFIDDEKMDHYFSITAWIALGDYGRDSGSLGLVRGSHRFFDNVNCSPSPAARTATKGLEQLIFRYLTFPEMRAGDALLFNNRTIHAALPNVTGEQRIAVGIGLTPIDAEIYHYFLKPGTTDRVLKLRVDEDFFLHYDNKTLQGLWEAGRLPERCTVTAELPYQVGETSPEEFEELCRRHGSLPEAEAGAGP